MPVTAVVGGHWGDEGKGKVVDALAGEMDLVIRYNGGTNAGHTIVNALGTFRLHLVPSGVLHPSATCLIGPGVVVNPDALLEELAMLESQGVATHGVVISNRAHVVFPHHITVDVREEDRRGAGQHGTTKQGIWPAYSDKTARIGVRTGDLLHPDYLAAQVRVQVERANRAMAHFDGHTPVDADEVLERCAVWREALADRIIDSHTLVQRALRANRRILLEGHLGVMRDLDWGIYPYVTSSTCLPGGAAAGAGIPAGRITTGLWPGFPSDLVSLLTVLATQCDGQTLVHDWLYELRLFALEQLSGMGADLFLCDPHRIIVTGPRRLRGRQLDSRDLRSGMALIAAALAADGQSQISPLETVERGYGRLVDRLQGMGAKVAKLP